MDCCKIKCDKKEICGVDSGNVIYDGRILSTISAYDGDNLNGILKNIDVLLQDFEFKSLNGGVFIGINVGDGKRIYNGSTSSGIEQFKTLKVGRGIKMADDGDSLSFSLDEEYLKSFIKDYYNELNIKDVL